MFSAMAMDPEAYSQRLKLFVALAPAVILKHTNSPLLDLFSRFGNKIERDL